MLNFDFSKSWMLWVARLMFPFLLILVVVLRLKRHRKALPRPQRLQHTISTTLSSSKQHIALAESRPLFRIEEHTAESQSEIRAASQHSKSHFSRDALLSARRTVTVTIPHDLRGLSYHPSDNVQLTVQACSRTEAERQYLRSLIQFRAFKSSGLQKASWQEWNREAQNILTGALLLGCNSVGTEVYDIMTTNGVLVDDETFKLLVELAVKSGDLLGAKTYLQLMANAGFVVDENLPKHIERKSISTRPLATLNKDAPVFIPKLYQRS